MRNFDGRYQTLTVSGEAASGWDNAAAARVVGGRSPSAREEELTVLLEKATAEREQALQALQTERCEADRHQEEFLAALAHELRNPLASIRSAVQIMRMTECDQATASTACAMIERQLKQLVQLIDDLLDVSRITQGKLELRRARVDLATIIQIAVEANRPLLESKQQHVRIEWPSQPLYVEADTTRLAQVFSNLLNNSAKYSDSQASIGIRAVREGAYAAVTVADPGIGIEPDMLARVFDLFTQADRSQGAPHIALSIGLTLVKHLVELHGGTVSAHSDGPGTGSVFTVRLALLEATDANTSLLAPANSVGRAHPHARILIADDDRDAARSLALMLAMEGHEVRTAYDGAEALQIAEDFHPQVALLDIGMPKLDGYETARRLRRRPEGQSTLLVAQTGWGQEDDKQRAKQAGFDRHLVKPLDPEALNQLLSQALESSQD
jgi:signal transduction histidine kinase/ActR/RegA family two-component response regulator